MGRLSPRTESRLFALAVVSVLLAGVLAFSVAVQRLPGALAYAHSIAAPVPGEVK